MQRRQKIPGPAALSRIPGTARRAAARRKQTARQGNPRQDRQRAKGQLHSNHSMSLADNGLIVVGDVNHPSLRRHVWPNRCRTRAGRCSATCSPTSRQRHGARIRRGRRTVDFPNVLVLRGNPRQQSEGYGRAWIRHWECSDCGATHDRDVNAALNILRVGRERPPPAVEIPAL